MNDDRFSQIDPDVLEQMKKMLDRVSYLGNTDRADEMRVMLESLDVPALKVTEPHSHETRAQRRARERAEAKQARRKAA
jgi:hypothetical protein